MSLPREENTIYQRNRRAAERLEKDNAKQAVEQSLILDGTGKRYKSEARSYADLYRIYYGTSSDPAPSDDDKKKKAKKPVAKPFGSEILGSERTFEEWLDLRDRARKELFWLGKEVLKKDLIPATHQAVCDQFVQKNFDDVYFEGFTIGDVHKAIDKQERFDDNGNETKEMMLIDPRGFFKSTIDGVDCVQWMLNVPDVRILILTGEYKLALSFMSEIKDYFYLSLGSDPTDIQLLFPEYILLGVDGTSNEPIWSPARIHAQRQPTLWINAITANLSGWHCDIKKGDDIVTDENSNTDDARLKLKEKYDGTSNLLDEWGFSDHIGTRYFADDWYGTRLNPEDPGDFVPVKYFFRQCWVVKPGYADLPLKQLTQEMVVLNFPEKATFISLRKKLLTNERQFRNQQLNEPSEDEGTGVKITFDEDVLRRHIYQASAAPSEGDTFICWDWAPTAGKYSDMSVGIAGRVFKAPDQRYGLCILEAIYDRWKPSELAFQIVAFNKKWHPKKTIIENSPGSELLKLELSRQAMKYGESLDVFWKPLTLQPDAKRNRIKGVETLLNDGLLWFVSGAWIDEMFKQFIKYTGERKNKGRKDDIPDAVSFLCFFLPRNKDNDDLKQMEEEQEKSASLKRNYDAIFGGAFVPKEPEIDPRPSPTDPRLRFGIPGIR
jgi:hypothetical protein